MDTIKVKSTKLSYYMRRKIANICNWSTKRIPADYELVDQDGLGNYFSIYKPGKFGGLDLISGVRLHLVS